MKIIIYRQNGKIYRIEDACEVMKEHNITFDVLQEKIDWFNNGSHAKDYGNSAELHEVHDSEVELINMLVCDGDMLFADKMVHEFTEAVPKGVYIYELLKHPEHDTFAISVTKYCSDNIILPNIVRKDKMLPIAWVKAKDLMSVFGLTKRDVKRLFERAKSEAWPWYDKDNE